MLVLLFHNFWKILFMKIETCTFFGGVNRGGPLPFFLVIRNINLGAETISSGCVLSVQLIWFWLCKLKRQDPIVVKCRGFRSAVSVLLLLGVNYYVDYIPLKEGLTLSLSWFLHFKSEDCNIVLAQCMVPNNCSLYGTCHCHKYQSPYFSGWMFSYDNLISWPFVLFLGYLFNPFSRCMMLSYSL